MKQKSVLMMLDPLSLPRLEAILAYAREHAWAVILEDRLPEGGLERIDGALVSLRGRAAHLDKIRKLRKQKKPVVDLTVACPKVRLPRVVSDHRALGALAAQHFLERGFTHFAWYASGSSHVHDLRRQGFFQTLRQAGFTAANLRNLPNLPNLPRPLALLAFDESDAAHVIAVCRQLKLDVPGDVAVLGIGNDPFLCENGETTISSVDQNLRLAARTACSLLDELMSPPSARNQTLHQPKQSSNLAITQSNQSNNQSIPQSNNQTILIPPVGVIPRASTETLAHPNPAIRAALVYIHRHLDRAFGAAETAEAVGIPRSTLDHLFTETVGHSIGREILAQRIARAKHLLKDPSVPLNAIARVCGFCNASYFTNTFHRQTGLTPKAWRKRD